MIKSILLKKRIFSIMVMVALIFSLIPVIPGNSSSVNAATTPSIYHRYPLSTNVNWKFDHDGGEWNDWTFHSEYGHYGVDINGPDIGGKSVYATAPGTVIRTGYNANGYGNYVVIKHSDGICSLYAHLKSRTTVAKTKNKAVTMGTKLGTVGNTGQSFGDHLHYGMYKDIQYFDNERGYKPTVGTINPELYLGKWEIKGACVASSGKPRVSWPKYSSASYYKVWYKKSSASSYSSYKTTKTYMTNTSAEPTWLYKYKVKAYNSKGTVLKTSTEISICCDLQRPVISSISKTSSGNVKVSFKGVKNANMYKVYRATSPNGTYKCVVSVATKLHKGGESCYIITSSGTTGTRYYYKVQATHSSYSNADSALSDYKSIIR